MNGDAACEQAGRIAASADAGSFAVRRYRLQTRLAPSAVAAVANVVPSHRRQQVHPSCGRTTRARVRADGRWGRNEHRRSHLCSADAASLVRSRVRQFYDEWHLLTQGRCRAGGSVFEGISCGGQRYSRPMTAPFSHIGHIGGRTTAGRADEARRPPGAAGRHVSTTITRRWRRKRRPSSRIAR